MKNGQTISGTAAAIREILRAKGLDENSGTYAVYRDIYQTDASGRDFADYAGPIHAPDKRPQVVCDTVVDAARKLDEIRDSGTLGGYRYGRIAYRPTQHQTRGNVVHVTRGSTATEIDLVKIGQRGALS